MPTEHSDSYWIICPYCNHKHNDADEYFMGMDGTDEQREMECEECGEVFVCTRVVSVDYDTVPVEKKEK